jgi:uncharacterized protein (DUF305 family)
MKHFLYLAIPVIMASCNNDEKNSTHTGHKDKPTQGKTSVRDTASNTGMMVLMHENMAAMKAIPSKGNADQDFAALMRIHHQGAVEMAQLELAEGKDTAMRNLAKNIINSQQKEIGLFDRFLAGKQSAGNTSAFYSESMAMMDRMHMDHSGGQTYSVDMVFAETMIPHHQSGVEMAQAYLKNGASDPQLRSMAEQIILDQKKEIAQMQDWIRKNKKQPL